MKTSERFALDEWLFEYPKNATFDDVLYLLLNDDDETVAPWKNGHPVTRREVAQNIANTQTHFAVVTGER
jgi:hypothetical protein